MASKVKIEAYDCSLDSRIYNLMILIIYRNYLSPHAQTVSHHLHPRHEHGSTPLGLKHLSNCNINVHILLLWKRAQVHPQLNVIDMDGGSLLL